MIRLLLLLFCALCSVAQATPLRLDLEVRREVSVDGQSTPAALQEVTVILAADYLEIAEQGERIVHDFPARRSYRVKGEEVLNRSLYADLGFRVAEMRNRLGLQEAMKGSGQESDLLGDSVLVEHLFSIDDEVTESALTKTKGAVTSFKHRGKLLAEFSSQGKKLEPDQMKAFLRFLRYYCGGHPDILADLALTGTLPEETRLDFYNLNEVVSYRIHLGGSQTHAAARPDFSSVPMSPPAEPLKTLGEAALRLSAQTVAQAAGNAREASQKALTQADVLGAALRLFEAMLMDGGDITGDLTRMRPNLEANPDAAALMSALLDGDQDPAAGEKALLPIEAKAGPGAHVVAIFRAGLLMASRRPVEARDLYVRALSANPAIAGAWKDLGDIYHSNYETDIAWACWDIGRYLAPTHPMLAEVDKLEEYLRSNHPGFF